MVRLCRCVAVVLLLLGSASVVHDSQFSATVVPVVLSDLGENVEPITHPPQPSSASRIPQSSLTAPNAVGPQLVANYGKLPLSFEVNEGQADAQVKFLSRGRGYSLFLTDHQAVLALRKGTAAPPERGEKTGVLPSRLGGHVAPEASQSQVVHMHLAGANPAQRVVGLDELPGKVNYFIGNDPAKWRTNVATYAKVKYEDVYPGVDLVYYGNQGQLEYDFLVAPGVDPSVIQLSFKGSDGLRLNGEGDLLLDAAKDAVRFQKPVVYQQIGEEKKLVEGTYLLASANHIAFRLGDYDHSRPLVIDPALVYSTYLGGSGTDFGNAIAVDGFGNAYVTGSTNSSDFPTTNGGTISQETVAFVTKLNPSGSALVYSTYLGGDIPRNTTDQGMSIAVDSSGNAYVTGLTESTSFPTVNALQGSFAGKPGNENAFVSKLNPSGSALIYSTYLGGNGGTFGRGDLGQGIAVDGLGYAYVVGSTSSPNFPTANALQGTLAGVQNAFVSKLNPSGSAFVYSTFLGGSNSDAGNGIAVDGSGDAYVTGVTLSLNFPTANALQSTLGGPGLPGGSNAFVTKLNPIGSALVYSTYLGGSGGDSGQGIAVDRSGSVYITGSAVSPNFPTANALQNTLGSHGLSGASNAFVTKLNPSGSALVYSTYLGGSGSGDMGRSISVDGSGDAYVTGSTSSPDFPTASALQPRLQSTQPAGLNTNAFVSSLNSSGSALIYSTYLGGTGSDQGNGIAVDALGNAYVTGDTNSSNFPTASALQVLQGGFHAFVARISFKGIPTTTSLVSSLNPGYLTQSLTFTATVRPPGLSSSNPTGTLTFLDGVTQLAQVTLNSAGQAQFATSALSAGTHTITAQYNGDSNFSTSSGTLTQVINPPPVPSAITLVSSVNPSKYSQPVTFLATVTPQPSGITQLPTGEVVFLQTNLNGSPSVLGSAALNSNGQATFTTVALSPSYGLVQVYYVGDSYFAPNTATIAQTVNQPPQPVSVSISPLTSTIILGGNSQQYTATAHYSDGNSINITSLVNWSSSNSSVATISSSGLASTNANPGVTTISATYRAYGINSSSATLGVEVPGASVLFLGGGSSAMFLELGQAAQSSAITATPCVWTQSMAGNFAGGDYSKQIFVESQGAVYFGDMWITWSPGQGTCSSPSGNFNILAYTSLDSTVGLQCYFEVPSIPGCEQFINKPAGTPGQNLLCTGQPSCSYGPDTPLPQAAINALYRQHWFAAGTDILPVDAKFAVYRALQPCTQPIYRQPFDQGLTQTFGLGFASDSSPQTGYPIASYFNSHNTVTPVNFNIIGRDPLNTAMTVPSYSISTLGAKPVIIAASPGNGPGIGAATDITSFNLALFTSGVLGRTTDLIGPTETLPVTTLIDDPLSGAYNVLEYSIPNSNQFHLSQDYANCNAYGQVGSNPLYFQSTNGKTAALRTRAMGTSEMIAQIQAAPNAGDQRLGYFFWSAANAASFTAANGKYLTVNGVDPLQNQYTDGVLPGSDPAHPLSNVTFQGLNAGDYPIWSVMRIVSQSPTPVGVSMLISALQQLNATQHNFVPPANLQVWHSHYYLPLLANGLGALGTSISSPGDLCAASGAYPETGGDAGGANVLKQVNADFCVDFSNTTGLINATN